MNRRKCWICGAGDFTSRLLAPRSGELVVAADGGLAHLKRLRILPQHILGDFDSLGYRPAGENVEGFPPEKDDTDMLMAVKYGLRQGCGTFLLYGGLGGRLSHTMANLQVLRFLCSQGCHGILVGEDSIITMIQNETVTFREPCRGMLSVFSQGGTAEGVTIQNLKYTVQDACLTPDYPLGVSNEFIGEEAEISVRHGTLLLVWEDAASDFAQMRFRPLRDQKEREES